MSFYKFENYELIKEEFEFRKKKRNWYYFSKYCEIRNKYYYYGNNRRVKNIYYIMTNVSKLKDGKIKRYRIFTELELKILSDFLEKNNILFTIYIKGEREELYKNIKDKLKFYMKTIDNMEYNYVSRRYELYIQVYKGYINLFEKYDLTHKYKIYIYDRILYNRSIGILN